MRDHALYPNTAVAWNGVRLTVARGWELCRIGERYLQFEDDDGPVLELKWQPFKGRAAQDRHLRRLAGGRARRQGVDFAVVPLPRAWSAAVAGFHARCFTWKGPSTMGKGLVLQCDTCRTVHLIQFLRQDIVQREDLCSEILRSFRDHPSQSVSGWTKWSVYGIKAEIPDDFRLQRYTFNPGALELTFQGAHGTTLTLYRWGPASVLLNDQSLDRFVTHRLAWARFITHRVGSPDGDMLLIQAPLFTGGGAKWIRRLGRRPLYGWLFAAWDEARNRIVAVSALGRRPLPHELLQTISDRYELV